jgi:hypothetical protein
MKEPLLVQKQTIPKERSDAQLFRDGKFKRVALSGELHAYLPQKGIEKKN